MKFIIDTEENVAKKAAQRYVDLLKQKPDAVLGFATGSTPLGLYAELARLCRVFFFVCLFFFFVFAK